MRRKITGEGGLVAHLGENDLRKIEERISNGETHAKEVYDAMLYQVSKEIGSMAAALQGDVDAVLITGGMAHSRYAVDTLRRHIGFLAPIKVYPGELEMESLGKAAYRALEGIETIKEL